MAKAAKNQFADVVVELPVEGEFTYSVPGPLSAEVRLGVRVLVPFGTRTVTGYVVKVKNESEVKKAKHISDVLDDSPIFDAKKLKFLRWLASYYFAPLGEVLSLIHPRSVNIKSVRRFTVTPEGEGVLSLGGFSEGEGEVLKRAARGGGTTLSALTKALKGKPVYSVIKALVKKGLIAEKVVLKGGKGAKTESVVTLTGGLNIEETVASLDRAPVQAKVLSHLAELGGARLAELREFAGGAASAVKALEAKGLVEIEEREVRVDPFSGIEPRRAEHEPNSEQARAIESVTGAFDLEGFVPFLLHGVTGSGKTLVYLRLIEEALKRGKRAVVLVPEISLTPRAAAYLTEHFPGRVALLHSSLSDGERYSQWRRIIAGEVDVVVGTRSALFSPLPNVGLIIVDEEHDPSYKQEEGVRYNARDAAVMLANSLGVPILLGSATPSVETFYNAKEGRYTLLELRERPAGAAMPEVELMDMRGRKKEVLSDRLVTLVKETVDAGDQVLLFLNRRGYSNFLICSDCGRTFECLNCSVTLTLHRGAKRLKCHYCDLSVPIPEQCPGCEGNNFSVPGMGTERVEEELRELLPKARVGRMDRDTTRRKGVAKEILDAVDSRDVDILVGTQMVGKGHDFPGITLVGVISGDTSLMIPDFRGAERTFQLISQAAGRAGRGEREGRVVVQTLNPDHFCFKAAREHDFQKFYDEEVVEREELSYPPFSRLALVRLDGTSGGSVERGAMELKYSADALKAQKSFAGVTVLGPVPALLSKLKGRHRWQLLVKAKDARELNRFVSVLKRGWDSKGRRNVRMTIDVDPLSTV